VRIEIVEVCAAPTVLVDLFAECPLTRGLTYAAAKALDLADTARNE
jgi:hypothetical protein